MAEQPAGVDLGQLGGVADQDEAGVVLDGVADQDEAGVVLRGGRQQGGQVAGADHAGLVDDEHAARGQPARRPWVLQAAQDRRDRGGGDAGRVLELLGGQGGGGAPDHELVVVAPGGAGGGQRGGLAGPGRPDHDGQPAGVQGEGADEVGLLPGQPVDA